MAALREGGERVNVCIMSHETMATPRLACVLICSQNGDQIYHFLKQEARCGY